MTLLLALFACASDPAAAETVVASDPEPLTERVAALGLPWPPPNTAIRIDKSERRLELTSDGALLKTYRVGLGSPEGDKVQQGDLKTPTGEFTVVTRNPESLYHLFLGLSYPMPEDADRGVAAGLITESEAEKIRAAGASRSLPPWDTTLGGAIGIHGSGGSADWTLGCIAVDDHEIDELWAATVQGTTVTVEE